MNNLLTAQEVADRLKIRKTTVYELIKRGELGSSKVGKQLRISEEQLEQYIKGTPSQPPVPSFTGGFQPESSLLKRDYLLHSTGIILSGQTSPALELLLGKISTYPGSLPVLQSHMNDYNGIYALYFEKAHIAAASLNPEDVKSLAPGLSLALLTMYEYRIGFYVKKGNPRNITSVQDLAKEDVTLTNREKGSLRRIYLDRMMKKSGIRKEQIAGYGNETVSDMSAASTVSDGSADAAIGEEMISRYFTDIDFIPLEKIPMYLIMPDDSLEKAGLSPFKEIIQSPEFKREIENLTGYDTSNSGKIIFL
ncbi:MAG: helix-turn-helix transcriptional regulator [Clostridia bacterium]|nr:helix-turn-helix transcriptional regulator [Clostridia bacterium]MDY5554671.1 helix-turn-helix transcriptional regulator [Blautia sp.]